MASSPPGVRLRLLHRHEPNRAYLPPETRIPGPGPDPPVTSRHLLLDGDPDAGGLLLEPAGESARAEVVVLVHGGGNDRLYGLWYAIDRLVEAGYAVATCHLPGHGQGGTDSFTLDAARRRLSLLLGTLRRDLPPGRVVALGQSLGGSLALDLMARGEPIDAVVAVSAPCRLRLGPSAALELLSLLRPHAWRALAYGSVSQVLPALGPYGRDRLPVRVEGGASYPLAFTRALDQLDLAKRLPTAVARPPCLLVHGLRDQLVPVAQAHRLAAAAGASLVLRDRPGHLDILFDPGTLDAILAWLAALPGRATLDGPRPPGRPTRRSG